MCLSILFEFFCKSYSGFSILSTSTSRTDSAPVATKEEVIKYLEENEIFKDVVPYFEPKVQLRARFLASGEEANFGNIIYPSEAQTRPVIDILPFPGEERIPEDIAGRVAYIVGTDPDAPTRENPIYGEFCHWIAKVVISKSEARSGCSHKTKSRQLLEWIGPGPPKSSGQHRYIFLLLIGDESHAKAPKDRIRWGNERPRTGVKQWADKYGLKIVGANFFISEYKEDVEFQKYYDEEK